MTNQTDNMSTATTDTWQLNALTEALGDLTLTVSDSLSVGRGSDNDVVLGSKQISRNHALLSVLNGQLYVKDLDSSNGTFINDERIDVNVSKHLEANDTLGFASFSFKVRALATIENEPAVTDKPTLMLSPDTEIAPIVEAEPVDKETFIEEILPIEDNLATTSVTEMQAEQAVSVIKTDEPVIKETGIEEVLLATDNIKPAAVEATPIIAETSAMPTPTTQQEAIVAPKSAALASTNNEPLIEQPVLREAPVISTTPTLQEENFQPEHDKTTKTTLQEEADPDILHAKQAATGQFSGTANLGQPRDLGTAGNNAMDQAINNPANEGSVEKKPSGSWFIWVFLAIIIIGLALWLFNKGGV